MTLGGGPFSLTHLKELRKRTRTNLITQLGSQVLDEAPLLGLLDDMTVETNDDNRCRALQLLMVSPFAPSVGHTYAQELACGLDRHDEARVHEALSVLLCLTLEDAADLVTDVAVRERPGVSPLDDIAVEACWAIGNATLTQSARIRTDSRIAASVEAALSLDGPAASDELFEAWAYALALHGRRDMLNRLKAETLPEMPGWTAAREWWLKQPAYLTPALQER